MNTDLHFIAIEGVIGAGKTSLAQMLAARINARLVLEKFDANPFLDLFYEKPELYAFQTQVSFLMSRIQQQQEIGNYDLFHEYVITDYIFEKDRIFANMNLNGEELNLYNTIVNAVENRVVKPDLVIYLQSSVERLMENIKKRSRKSERHISRSYIETLSNAYNDFFFRYHRSPVLIIQSSDIDFVNEHSHFEELVEQVLHRPHDGLEYYLPSGVKS